MHMRVFCYNLETPNLTLYENYALLIFFNSFCYPDFLLGVAKKTTNSFRQNFTQPIA